MASMNAPWYTSPSVVFLRTPKTYCEKDTQNLGEDKALCVVPVAVL